MTRYKLIVEYDGVGLHGWQRQNDVPSGQQYLEEAIFQFCGENPTVHCAGRTDAGVHARGQVIHFDLHNKEYSGFRVKEALNYYLKETQLSILDGEVVSEDFHARFSATGRRYMYRIINRRAPLALDKYRAWQVSEPLNITAMIDATHELLGHHDFTSFRDSECQANSAMKTLDEMRFEPIDNEEFRIHVASRSFLHHQVRIMVGSLYLVGKGKWTRNDLAAARDAKNRHAAGPTAPAEGLYLTKVIY
ncbi:MAG: tRNA pseudouridine(38-40) synthase TruA [Alphaproteobacteria bacterium]|nr:tRNA pseudouridine(38-40) synthase TruA [Alphaproteobacteria bacterium]